MMQGFKIKTNFYSFQDRGKRLKLHQFIAKKADVLFNPSLVERDLTKQEKAEPGLFAAMPAYESFLNLDKTSRTQHFLQVRSIPLLKNSESVQCRQVNCCSFNLFYAFNKIRWRQDRNIFPQVEQQAISTSLHIREVASFIEYLRPLSCFMY